MENGDLRRSITIMEQSLFDEGILDGKFSRLQRLQNKDKPYFVEEVFTVYFEHSTELLDKVEQEMNTVPTDFSRMDSMLSELKDNAASIGLSKVRNAINKTRSLLREGNLEGAKVAFQDVRNEHDILQTKLKPYFQQLRLQAQQKHRRPGEAITQKQ